MKTLNNTTLFIGVLACAFAGVFGFAPLSLHAANLEVDFEAEPLFSEVNFLPGSDVERAITITNNSESTQSVIVEAINAFDDEELGDVLNLIITKGETTLFDDTLGAFLRTGEVSLASLGSGESAEYLFHVAFEGDADNSYQETGLGFDLCVGFEGGETSCGDTVISGEGDTGDGSSGGGGGSTTNPGTGSGGGGGIFIVTPLEISDEDVTETDIPSGTALIEWNTNLLSTSQVIYGTVSGGPYSLNILTLPYFGYPSGTVESTTKVTEHSVLLTGLIPGETYLFRVVSRASPPTVGFEYVFTFVPNAPVVAQNTVGNSSDTSFTNTNGAPSGTSAQGAQTSGEGASEGGDVTESLTGSSDEAPQNSEEESNEVTQAAAAFFALPSDLNEWLICVGIPVLVVLALYVLWLLCFRRLFAGEEREKHARRRTIFLAVGLLAAIVAAVYVGEYCMIPTLVLLFLVTLVYHFV